MIGGRGVLKENRSEASLMVERKEGLSFKGVRALVGVSEQCNKLQVQALGRPDWFNRTVEVEKERAETKVRVHITEMGRGF